MMAADSPHVGVHLIVPSGVSCQWPLPCRRTCSACAFAPHFAQPPAQPSSVQASCLERARPVAVAALAGALAASSTALPGADAWSEIDSQRRKARQKGAAPSRPQSQSAHGVGAARRGFAAVPRGARSTR